MLTIRMEGLDKVKRKLKQMQTDAKRLGNRRFRSRQELEREVQKIIRKRVP